MFSIEEVASMHKKRERAVNEHLQKIDKGIQGFAENDMLNYAELGFYTAFLFYMNKFNDGTKALQYLNNRGSSITSTLNILESTVRFTKAHLKE